MYSAKFQGLKKNLHLYRIGNKIVIFPFQSLLANGPSHPQNKYMKLENEIERSNQRYIEDTQGQQQVCMNFQLLMDFRGC